MITKKGLSLVEVLLAVSILALGIVGVLRGYAASIAVLEAAQANIDAVNLLKEKMGDLEVMVFEKEEIAAESGRGAFEAPFEDFAWEWSITPEEEEGLFKLALTVSNELDPRTYTTATLIAGGKSDEEDEGEE